VRKLLIVAVLVLASGLMAVFSPSASSARRVNVGDNYFVRPSGVPTVTVSKGTRVRWVWVGDNPHNVSARGPVKFGSATKSSGSFSKKMRRRGTYTIVCTVHGGGDQKMKLVVK
jgi:plastocyanin